MLIREATSRSIRICQVWTDYLPIFGGAAIRYNESNPRLREQRLEIEVLTPRWQGLPRDEEIKGVPVRRVSVGRIPARPIQWSWNSLLMCRELWTHREKYDVVHAITTNAFYTPVFLLSKLLRKPVIIEFTVMPGQMTVAGRALAALSNLVLRLMDAYIGLSTPLIRSMTQRGLASPKCHLIPPGIDSTQFLPADPAERERLRADLGMNPSTYYLVSVGSFIRRKGVDILLEMMECLRTRDDIKLVIIGEHGFPEGHPAYPFAQKMKAQLQNSSLGDRVHLVGLVDRTQVLRWLQASDIFVFPSRREGLASAQLQAMAVGLACVCSDLDGIAYDMIEPGVNGIIVKENSPAAFSQQVIRLIEDTSLRLSLGSEARKTVIDRFDEKKAAIKYRQLCENVLGFKTGRAPSA